MLLYGTTLLFNNRSLSQVSTSTYHLWYCRITKLFSGFTQIWQSKWKQKWQTF